MLPRSAQAPRHTSKDPAPNDANRADTSTRPTCGAPKHTAVVGGGLAVVLVVRTGPVVVLVGVVLVV